MSELTATIPNAAANGAAARRDTTTLGRWWWTPSAAVVLALLLLVVVPTLVDRRVTEIRAKVTTSENARVSVNDLEAAFASELLLRNATLAPSDTPEFAQRAHLNADESKLGDEVAEIDSQAIELFEDLRRRLRTWDSASPNLSSAETAKLGFDLLASAERLDTYLTQVSDRHRSEVRRLERYYVRAPIVLAPVALIAMLLVTWSGVRVRRFARIADEERAEVIRSAEARAALLRGVTHDVKNPLGAAAGYAQLLEEGVVGSMAPPQIDMVRRIHRLVRASAQTVSDLLELARADGELHIQYAAIDLATIVTDVVEDHRGMAREHGITIECEGNPTAVVTDPLRVRQILSNLVSNAIKYTPQGGRVDVGIVPDGTARATRVGVEVRDTGPGVPPELQSRVFEEFFRVRNADAASTDGNGLGLAISRRIARLIGGDVTIASRQGGGSIFTLWIPASSHRG